MTFHFSESKYEALSDFPVLFKADLISKDFSRKPSEFKYFLSLCELCGLYYQTFSQSYLVSLS